MTNFDELWSVLTKYRFEIDSNISSQVKCIICERLLIDAYQGLCGCLYCLKCMSTYLGDEEKYCPGNTNDCKDVKLNVKDLIKDNATNRTVSQLIVKCSTDGCHYRCPLKNMGEHLRLCSIKSIACPFMVMGCSMKFDQDKAMSDHLLTDIVQHNVLLTEWMMNIKNEFVSNSRQDLLVNAKLSQLMQTIDESNRTSELCHQHQNIIDQMQTEIENLRNMNDQLVQGREEDRRELHKLQMQINQLLQKPSNDKCSSTSSSFDQPESTNDNSREFNQSLDQSPFIWNIPERSTISIIVSKKSEYFYSFEKSYAMWLVIHCAGCHEHSLSNICAEFCVKNADMFNVAPWPFRAFVTICLTSVDDENVKKSVSKHVSFEEPWRWSWSNEYFHFPAFEQDTETFLLMYRPLRVCCSVVMEHYR